MSDELIVIREADGLASRNKKSLQVEASRQAQAYIDADGDPVTGVALARKLKVFSEAFGKVVEAAAKTRLDHLSEPETAHGVTVELVDQVSYDFSESPAWNLLQQRIDRLISERDLVQERAKALAKKFRTEAQPEFWNDPETGEQYEIKPAARTATPTLKCTVK